MAIEDTKYLGDNALTMEQMKELLGWQEEPVKGDGWGENYFLKDMLGKKVRLKHNSNNRPFNIGLAKEYMLEHLRGKWEWNGDTMVFDNKGQMTEGQHRGVGFIFAEQVRSKDPAKAKTVYGLKDQPLKMETIVIRGISSKSDVVDTSGTGRRRSLADVVYRDKVFSEGSPKDRQRKSKLLAEALRLLWLRTGGRVVSSAPKFPISEAMEVLKKQHPRLKEAVEIIEQEEQASEQGISRYLPKPTAAALLYLMGSSRTKIEKHVTDDPGTINWDNWKKACQFWSLVASGAGLEKGDAILVLRAELLAMISGSGKQRDEVIGVTVKAFNCWMKGETVTPKNIRVKKIKDEDGAWHLDETPRVGGLDVDSEYLDQQEDTKPVADNDEEDEKSAKKAGKEKKAAKAESKEDAKPESKPAAKRGRPAKYKAGDKLVHKDEDGAETEVEFVEYKDGDCLVVTTDNDKEHWLVETETLTRAA